MPEDNKLKKTFDIKTEYETNKHKRTIELAKKRNDLAKELLKLKDSIEQKRHKERLEILEAQNAIQK